MEPYVIAQIGICRTDDQKGEWQYVASVMSLVGDAADKAPVMRLPSLEKLTVSVTGKPANGALGVGVRLLAGKAGVSDVRKD